MHQLPDLPNIMINLDLAERLCQDGINASSFYPGGNVITTSTIHDSILAKYTVENEIDIIKTFRPRWHIPSDVPVYHEDCDEGRARFIEFFVEDTLTFIHQIKGHNIGIIPLVKGINGDEWLMSTQPFVDMGITEFAFYVRQYFGSTKGRNERLMVRDLQSLISTCEVGYLMLIGYQSNQYLTQLPPQVKCFAGERWVRNSILKKGNADSSKESYLKWNDAFFSSCGTRQTVLGSFLYAHEKEVV